MATAAVDEEDVLMCTVCLDSYTDPCTLQCKHSFCRRCITDYVKTQPDAVKAKRIPCPFCRQVTQVPDPSRPVDEWAGQLQPGHVVQELMATVKTEIVEGSPCSPCQRQGDITPGKFWCAECEEAYCQGCGRAHSGMAMTCDHDLCDIKDRGKLGRYKRKCQDHKDQLLQLYCKDCNVIHCHLCFVDHHRKCEEVITIKSFMSDIKNELSDVHNQLDIQQKKSFHLVEQQKTTILKLNKDRISVVDEIRCASQLAVDLIKNKEKQLIEQVEEVTERETNELKALLKSADIQMQTYRQYKEYIKRAVSSDNEVEVCGVYQVLKSGQLDISQEGEKGTGKGNISSVKFSIEKQNITQVLDSLHLGAVVTTYLPTDSQSYPVLIDSHDARMQEDKKDPLLHDITVLEVGGLNTAVVTDCNNNCVKSYYTRNNKKCYSRLQFDNNPKGITQLGDTNVVIAVPGSKQIVTIAVTPDLVKGNVINTSKKYSSLAVISPSRLAVGGYRDVDILNMQGEVMKTVTTHNMDLFKCSDFMCVSMEHLLVTDLRKKTVTCLTPEGQVVWVNSCGVKCKPRGPRGITTTSEGDIIMADVYYKKVIQLSAAGEYVRDILTSDHGIRYPRGICADTQGLLYICDREKMLKFVFVRK